jgi:hypothetical protein
MLEERNNISIENLTLLVIRAERYKSKAWTNIKSVYQILDEDCDKPAGHFESILRYIPGDPNDSFDVTLN